MSEWFETLEGLYDGVWQRLAAGVADAGAPARHPVLASVTQDGAPAARIVVLRGEDRAAGWLDLHTDAQSEKVAELTAEPRAALHVWEPDLKLQMRLTGRVAILTGADAAEIWAGVPEGSRGNYGVVPAPGTPIPASGAFERRADPARFAVLRLHLDAIEALHLGRDHHRRARFARVDGWRGGWIAP